MEVGTAVLLYGWQGLTGKLAVAGEAPENPGRTLSAPRWSQQQRLSQPLVSEALGSPVCSSVTLPVKGRLAFALWNRQPFVSRVLLTPGPNSLRIRGSGLILTWGPSASSIFYSPEELRCTDPWQIPSVSDSVGTSSLENSVSTLISRTVVAEEGSRCESKGPV